MDSENLLQCPYDKNHMIRPSRFPYHLVKCRENNQAAAKVLATCPYNARHRVPKKELELHMQTCESKCPLEPLPAALEEIKPIAEPVSSWQSPPSAENWEDDSPSDQSTFVLQEYGNYQPYSSHETTCDKPISSFSTSNTSKQATYGNYGKPEVKNNLRPTNGMDSMWKTVGDQAPGRSGVRSAVACHKEPVAPYQNMWASTATKPTQGGPSNREKSSVVRDNPWGTSKNVNHTACHSDAVKPFNNDWTSKQENTTSKPTRGGLWYSEKPSVVRGHPWGTNKNVNHAVSPSDSVCQYNNDWPSLENNRTFRDQQHLN